MKKFSVVIEVSMADDYKDMVEKWKVEPSDHVATILTETAREKGLVVKASVLESDHTLHDRLIKYRDHLVQADAYNDLENEIISRTCINGICED